MQRAKRLLEGLRIHHLGFGFFWTVTFIVLAGFQGAGAIADYWQIYILTEQTLMPLAVGALGALCAFRRCELPHWTASAASFLLSGAALLYFLAFHFGQGDGAIAAVAGVLMGGSCALFFLLWGDVLRNRRPAARPHLHSSFGGHVRGPLLAHLPSTLNRCGSDRRLRAAVSGASLPSEEPRRD